MSNVRTKQKILCVFQAYESQSRIRIKLPLCLNSRKTPARFNPISSNENKMLINYPDFQSKRQQGYKWLKILQYKTHFGISVSTIVIFSYCFSFLLLPNVLCACLLILISKQVPINLTLANQLFRFAICCMDQAVFQLLVCTVCSVAELCLQFTSKQHFSSAEGKIKTYFKMCMDERKKYFR